MTTPHFTDGDLEHLKNNTCENLTKLEMQLANVIIDDRKAMRQLINEIEPMANKVLAVQDDISRHAVFQIQKGDNPFARQLALIRERL